MPSNHHQDPVDPTGPAELAPDAIDIGVDAAPSQRPVQYTKTSSGSGPSFRVIAIIAGVVALAALIVGLVSGDDRDRASENPLPAPTSPPEVLDRPDPARPAPTATVQVPVVSDGLLRAGETCRIPIDADTSVAYTVPDGRTVRDCASEGILLRDPGSERADSLGSVFFSPQTLGLNLNRLRGVDEWAEASTTWHPVDNRRGYRLRRPTEDLGAWDQLDLVEVPGGTIVVAGRNRNYAPGIPQMVEELVATIRVEGPDVLPPPALPAIGGWCGGDHFVAEVPPGWFAGERCRWLNTSSESPEVLQCECLPPLWIESLDIPFDGDFGFNSVDVDRLVTRADGSVIRIIEGLRRDANNMDRPLRVVVVEGGVKRVTVVATEFPEHALPGHTWEHTLDAQAFVVESLHFHSDPGCLGQRERRVVASGVSRAALRVGDHSPNLPNGTLVETTGCVDDGRTEVRVVGAPELVGLMADEDLALHNVDACPSGERDFRPHEWLSAIVGDFDGDGRSDAAYLRDNPEGGSDVAVLFANGGLAERIGLAPISRLPTAARFVGLDRDLLQVVEQRDRGVVVSLLDMQSCEITALATWPLGFVDGARHGVCEATATTGGLLPTFRTWSESFDDRQGWVAESDRVWFPTLGSLVDGPTPPGAVSDLCGPTLTTFAPQVSPGSTGASLAGDHQLTLQWIQARDETAGSITFIPIGNDRYEVDGVHEAAFGFLSMRGVIERVDETTFAFDGTISSQIPWLNREQPCIRNAGQRFVLRTDTATPTFRMQDRINCDGARTDWIDIQLRG